LFGSVDLCIRVALSEDCGQGFIVRRDELCHVNSVGLRKGQHHQEIEIERSAEKDPHAL
jgi:hypothetical protein